MHASPEAAPPLTTVLFDIDGTLVDSNDAHARAWVRAFAAEGIVVPFSRVRPLIGMGGPQLVAALGLGLDAARGRGKAVADRRKRDFLDREAPTLRAFVGARDLVIDLHARGLRCAIASAASAAERDALLAKLGPNVPFDHAVEPDDVDASKPAPDIVVAALRWARASPGDAVMIGDTRYDLEAAHGAGVRTIALRCGDAPAEDLAGADAVFDDPADLLGALRREPLERLAPRAMR